MDKKHERTEHQTDEEWAHCDECHDHRDMQTLSECTECNRNDDELTESDYIQIAKSIVAGNTSGIIDGEEPEHRNQEGFSYRIEWVLKADKFKL